VVADAGAWPLQRSSATRTGEDRSKHYRLAQRFQIWAFIEAANAICIHRRRSPRHHVSRLYERIARRKGHPTAIGAVARHLAEATFWILSKHEPYREPRSTVVSSTRDKREGRLSS